MIVRALANEYLKITSIKCLHLAMDLISSFISVILEREKHLSTDFPVRNDAMHAVVCSASLSLHIINQ